MPSRDVKRSLHHLGSPHNVPSHPNPPHPNSAHLNAAQPSAGASLSSGKVSPQSPKGWAEALTLPGESLRPGIQITPSPISPKRSLLEAEITEVSPTEPVLGVLGNGTRTFPVIGDRRITLVVMAVACGMDTDERLLRGIGGAVLLDLQRAVDSSILKREPSRPGLILLSSEASNFIDTLLKKNSSEGHAA